MRDDLTARMHPRCRECFCPPHGGNVTEYRTGEWRHADLRDCISALGIELASLRRLVIRDAE